MSCFVSLKKTNGQSITINVGMIEWWRPSVTHGRDQAVTDVAYRGGFAHVQMGPDDFADLIRRANADVVEN